jgi:pyruvate/2-oxoglutarate dehydrogenase complex dihydrolipoamide dehydrogenase (E3) component
VAVTVVEAQGRLLPQEEPEAGDLLAEVLAGEGIDVRVGVSATSVGHHGESFALTLDDGTLVSGERLLVATGRRADVAGIGADAIGVDPTARFLPVDEHLRVVDGVWAVGDITGQGLFTHVGTYQADIAVADILGRDHEPADHSALPRVTFTDPEVGAVGLTEARARAAGIDVAVGSTRVPHTARGWIHRAGNEGFIKLVVDRERDVLVGATAAGPNGGEVLGMLALAVHARIPLDRLRTMIWAYPTFHRGIEDALRAIAP